MASQTAPIDIPSRSSASPKQNDSHLNDGQNGAFNGASVATSDIQMGGYTPVPGGIPITTTRAGVRRESLASGSASAMTGISWGPGSVSNWVAKDDIAMQGSSPYIGHEDMKSPAFHNSYLPKLEAEYMTGFICCKTQLANMHDLLKHFEEVHATESAFAQNLPATSPPSSSSNAIKNHKLAVPSEPQAQRPGPVPSRAQQATPSVPATVSNPTQIQQPQGTPKSQMPTVPDLDSLDELNMDDLGFDQFNNLGADAFALPAQYGGTTTPRNNPPALNINPAAQFQNFHNIRSQPQTPMSARSIYGNNPTVSSVNTPALVTNPLHQLQRESPGSSMPGTPGELDDGFVAALNGMQFEKNYFPGNQAQAFAFQNQAYGDNETIDDPGKRLTSPGGPSKATDTQDEVHQQLGSTQYGPDSDIAKTIRQRQLDAGMPDQDQPYLCPVIGCMKAYKNSNGLRYHKQHGHKDQALKNNADGTYSIVDSNGVPYPGTEGMARAKPFACKTCRRRYKNANGLKYHYLHNEGCTPEDPQANISDNANVAGAGIPGVSDS